MSGCCAPEVISLCESKEVLLSAPVTIPEGTTGGDVFDDDPLLINLHGPTRWCLQVNFSGEVQNATAGTQTDTAPFLVTITARYAWSGNVAATHTVEAQLLSRGLGGNSYVHVSPLMVADVEPARYAVNVNVQCTSEDTQVAGRLNVSAVKRTL